MARPYRSRLPSAVHLPTPVSLLRAGMVVGVLALLLGAWVPRQASASRADAGFVAPQASAGSSIPHVSMSFGMRPYANDAIYVIGMKQGWYKNVGITITPPPLGRKVLASQAIPLLVNRQLDAVALYPPDVIATQDTVKNIRFIALSDLFQGFAVLAAPGTHAKSVKDYLKQGMSFKQAITKAMGQLKGQKFATAPVVDNRAFLGLAFSLAGLDMSKDTQLIVTPDANALQMGKSGSVKFQSPTGAPFTAQLELAGWIPIVTPLDILQHIPGGINSQSETLVGLPGVASDAGWAQSNANTVLRFVSVMFRIIDFERRSPMKALRFELNYINAFAGTNLSLNGLRITIDELDPLLTWQEQKSICDNPGSALYYRTWYQATLNEDLKKKALPSGTYPVENLIWSCDVYHALARYKTQSDRMFTQLKSHNLAASQKLLVNQARRFYNAFDYLDSYRFLKVVAH